MTIAIDKSVPMPETNRDGRKCGEVPAALRAMEIGDSFFLPQLKTKTLASALSYNGSRLNRKFIQRKVTENGVEGTRVWRKA